MIDRVDVMAVLTGYTVIPIATREAFCNSLAAKRTRRPRFFKRVVLADKAVHHFTTYLASCAMGYLLSTSHTQRIFSVKVVLAEAVVVLGKRLEVFCGVAGQALLGSKADLASIYQTLN